MWRVGSGGREEKGEEREEKRREGRKVSKGGGLQVCKTVLLYW